MLSSLPVELLYEIQLYALSSDLPLTCKRLYDVYKTASHHFQAQYIFYHVLTDHKTNTCRLGPPSKPDGKPYLPFDVYSRVLRYPLCTLPVLYHIVNYFKKYDHGSLLTGTGTPELPRRLFRNLQTPPKIAKEKGKTIDPNWGWSTEHEPLPFLQVIYGEPPPSYEPLPLPLPPPNPNSHSGYALTKAVQVSFVPLVSFLLSHGALPSCKDGLTLMVAIRQKDLAMVKRLVERKDDSSTSGSGSSKRRRLPDRLTVTAPMLRTAVKVGAQDIIDYFMREKGVVPDIKTLYLLQQSGNGSA